VNGTTLVKALVGIGTLGPGDIGEMPDGLARMAIKAGFAQPYGTLTERLAAAEAETNETLESIALLGVAEVPPRFRPGTDEEVAAASADGGPDRGTLPE
jgi:hypothetical protein